MLKNITDSNTGEAPISKRQTGIEHHKEWS